MRVNQPTLAALAVPILTLAVAWSARADGFTNTFDTPFDYVANGVVGDTNWDGVYLRFGDIPFNQSAGGSGQGNTLVANSSLTFSGFLSLQEAGGDWSGADNDGFFLYKVVSGDFDVSVQSVPAMLNGGTAFDNRGFNFAGLMVRVYNTNNTGSGWSATTTNTVENSLRLWRFNEFDIDGQIRQSTNGANVENSFGAAGSTSETNTARFFRITRTGDLFQFYVKTNDFDPWVLITFAGGGGGYVAANGSVSRPDWAGLPVQVGIAQAAFSSASRDAVFDDFALTGPNVTFPAMPPAPSALVTTATNTSGSLAFSWTKGNAGDNSLVVIRRNGPLQHNPVQGITYNSSPGFGDTNGLIGGNNEYVVYNGAGNSVTVTNLGANNVTYTVGVYEYTGTGSSTVYNTANPATNTFAGPGVITSVALSAATSDIPTNGAVKLTLTATFSTGETSDQTAAATWNSANTAVATVAGGVVSGVSSGASLITATFGPFTPSVSIAVHDPVGFADNFTATHDYVASGLIGSTWDGLYQKFGDVPGAVAGNDGPGSTITMDTQITDTNGLYLSSVQSDWEAARDDGPFLYKLVPGTNNAVSGDFSAVLHINSMNTLNGVVAGVMARLFNPTTHSAGPGGTENHVNYWKVQNGTTSVRRTQNGGNTTVVAAGPAAANGWLLLQRVNSTNFYFFEKATEGVAWTYVTNVVLAAAAGNAPMEVGPAQQSTTGVNGVTTYDRFSLDAAGVVNPTTPPPAATDFAMVLNLNLTITISYTVGTNLDGTAIPSVVVMRANSPVSAQPAVGNNVPANSAFGDAASSLGGGNYIVYRSAPGDTNQNQSVIVSGLTPAVTYYAAVYTYQGTGAATTYNVNVGANSGTLVNGFLAGIRGSLPGGVPLGGIGVLNVSGIYNPGNNTAPILSGVTFSSGDTNVIKVLGGIMTGIAIGTAPVEAVFGGFTNVATVAVRPPVFADNFSSSRDYLTAGTSGSGWDGLYNPTSITNPIPGSPYVPLDGSGATIADANISSNNTLTITAAGDGWENDASGGFFLFKYVPGDFQAAVHISSFDVNAYNQPGILARAYGQTNGIPGAPFGTIQVNANGTNDLGEYWVSLTRFDEFNIGTYCRRNLDSGVSQNTQTDQNDTNYWLLIVRSKGSEFDFFKRLNPSDPWKRVPNSTHYSIPEFRNKPMQVGLMAGPWNGTGGASADYRSVVFENFMLDTLSPSITANNVAGNTVLQWPAVGGYTLVQSPSMSVPLSNWVAVAGTVLSDGVFNSITLPPTNNPAMFFVLRKPAP